MVEEVGTPTKHQKSGSTEKNTSTTNGSTCDSATVASSTNHTALLPSQGDNKGVDEKDKSDEDLLLTAVWDDAISSSSDMEVIVPLLGEVPNSDRLFKQDSADSGLESCCGAAKKQEDTIKRKKARRKPVRKRTPKAAIIPRKRLISSSDNIQENIQRLHEQYQTVKAKRRRLYVKDQIDNTVQPVLTNRVGIHNDSSQANRRLPMTRECKTAALRKIQEHDIPFPKGAFRKENIQDLDKVIVAIAPSSIPHAGLGLFLLSGPAEDGSAPAGTRVATYDGIHFRTRVEQDYVRSDKYQSDYVWEGINPFTRETVMVDGSPLNSYGPYMNDGLDYKEANAILVFGSDGRIYVETSTTVSKNAELLLSYGQLYWLDPAHWDNLPESTKESILTFYKCDPPQTLRTPIDDITHYRINSQPSTSSSGCMLDSGTVCTLDSRYTRCFGRSQDDTTRLSFCFLEETSSAAITLQEHLTRVSRNDAYQTLLHYLTCNDELPLVYWKKLDQTHYRDSPPDGACGWYTIAQAVQRYNTSALLNLYTKEGLHQAANILESLKQLNPICSEEGLQAFPVAIEWIKRKHLRPRATLEYKYQLFCEDYTSILDVIPTTLFILPSAEARRSSIQMPNDLKHEWLTLHSSSSMNRTGHESHISAFPLRNILTIAQGELFTQLAGGHYFLHPILSNEHLSCEQALRDLAYNLWDVLHSIRVDLLQFPDDPQTRGQLREIAFNNASPPGKTTTPRNLTNRRSLNMQEQAPSKGHFSQKVAMLQPDKPLSRSVTAARFIPPQVISSHSTIRHCYGKDSEDQIRLSLGSLNKDQLDRISNLHQLNSKENFIEQLCQAFHDEAHYRLHVWRKKDYTLWSSSLPDGACGWYTIANLHRRARALPLLNFSDQGECITGVNILTEAANISIVDNELLTKLTNACHWMVSSRLTPFNAQDQLSSIDFVSINSDISTAIFITPPYIDSPRMHTEEWILLYHHTASPQGSATTTLTELLKLARDGNYAQLVDHHFWPLPVLRHENIQIQQALSDLAGNIWNFFETIHYQSLLFTSHQANVAIDVDPVGNTQDDDNCRDHPQGTCIDPTVHPPRRYRDTINQHDADLGISTEIPVESDVYEDQTLLRDGHSQDKGNPCPQPQQSCDDHTSTLHGYADPIGTYNPVDPDTCGGRPSAHDVPLGVSAAIKDHDASENIDLRVGEEDPTAIYALQEQIFNPADHNDSTLQTGIDLKAHLRTASLNINGLTQQKLPLILTYIKKKKVDILTLQDTRLDDKDSQLIAMLIRKHFENCNIQIRVASVPSAIKRADRVGGQLIIIYGKWASRVTGFHRDFTNMGLLTGLTLQANKYKLLVLSAYLPIRPVELCDNSQLWNKVTKFLREHDNFSDPLEFIKCSVQERIKDHIKSSSDNVIILQGDLNSTWGSTAVGGCHKSVNQWASSISLNNPLHSLALQSSKPIFTHWIARHIGTGAEHVGISWIDHILLHSNGHPQLVRGGCEDHNEWVVVSDHRPIWIDVHLPLGLSKTKLITPYDIQPLPILDRTNSRQVEHYQRVVEKKVLHISETLSPADVIEAIANISVSACTKATQRPKTFYNSSKFKDGWSPTLVAKLAALTAVTTMRQHITGAHRRKQWWKADDIETGIKRVTLEWEYKLQALQFDTKEQHEEAHMMGKGPAHWRLIEKRLYPLLASQLRDTELLLKKKMHGRQRSLERTQMQNASAEREKAVSTGKIGKAIRAILGKSQSQYDMHTLSLPSGELIVDPLTIHDTHVEHWKDWLQGTNEKTFFDDHHIDWENAQLLWPQFRDYPAHKNIPAQLVLRIWQAITQPYTDITDTRAEIMEVLSQPISLDDLRNAIRKAPSGSVPGPSGLSYAMMKEWPESVLVRAHAAVHAIWEEKIIPACWNKKWLCPKPKIQPDLATLQDLRPLNLLETPRKILMGIVVSRITQIWERKGILSDSQYGFRSKRSCEGPSLQVINAQEEAEESGTELHGSSWDIKRAFDSVPKAVLVMSWERLGVPSEVANYIVDLDRNCLTIPLTPHAQHIRQTEGMNAFNTNNSTSNSAQGFLGVTGTSQGDTPSPSNWTATYDIPMRALEQAQSFPFLVRTDIKIEDSQDMSFADDILSLASRKEGLQDKAEVMSASSIIMGITFAIPKLRTSAITWGQEPSGYANEDYHIQVYDRDWNPIQIPVVYANKEVEDQSFRYLGVHTDFKNRFQQQFKILKEQVEDAAITARHRLASPDTITMAIKLSLHRKISFPGKFSPWSLQELRKLDTPLNGLYKAHLKFLPSAPNAALYMSKEIGGLGITRLSDQINIDKWAMMVRGLYSDRFTRTATLGILNRSLRIGQTDTDHGYEAVVKPAGIPHQMRSLIEIMDESGYQLRRSGKNTLSSPSKLVLEQLDITNISLKRKLMNYRITTLSDLMVIKESGNSWNQQLLDMFKILPEQLPLQCPTGRRSIRIGQYWASSNYDGQNGRIVEIMGIRGNCFNGRSWTAAIPTEGWTFSNHSSGRLTWVTPCTLSDSRGAGATEYFDTDTFFQGTLRIYTLSEEVPRYMIKDGIKINCVARAIRSSHEEDSPEFTNDPNTSIGNEENSRVLMESWDQWVAELHDQEVEVYTDGSVRYHNSVLTRVLTPPKPLRQPIFTQGGILIHFGRLSELHEDTHNITITLEQGMDVEILLPSSMELYSILLAVRLLHRAKLHGVIYTDFAEAVRIQRKDQLRNLGRKANLPIYEAIVSLLEAAPGIKIEHVKAHGDPKKQSKWTRAQWGNFYADKLAKGDTDHWATKHLIWPVPELETLAMNLSPWHWVSKDKHLLLEPVQQLIQNTTINAYLIDRDIYRVKRGQDEKWQDAHLGLIEDVWKTRKLKMGKQATINRLIWDKGWHGGNRAKATTPSHLAEDAWIGCGDCGKTDSQNHWIRECPAEHIRSIRLDTKEQTRKQLDLLQMGKFKKSVRQEIFSVCSDLVEAAFHGEGGEQLWVGIVPGSIVRDLTLRLPREEYPPGKQQIPNKWRRSILSLIQILAKGTQLIWQAKEKARTERLNGTVNDDQTSRRATRRRTRNQDIRILYRRIAFQQAKEQADLSLRIARESIQSDTLQTERSTAPINATRRLSRLNTARVIKARRDSKLHWTPSLEQEWFSLTRTHSNKMLTLKTGKGPAYRRNLRTQNYHTAFAMDWLQEYDRRVTEDSDNLSAEAQGGASYLELASSRNNSSIDDVCDCNPMNNLCYNNNVAGTRVGIG
jgi:exonuclease III